MSGSRTISIRLDEGEAAALDQLAQAENTTAGILAKRQIQALLQGEKPNAAIDCRQIAKAVIEEFDPYQKSWEDLRDFVGTAERAVLLKVDELNAGQDRLRADLAKLCSLLEEGPLDGEETPPREEQTPSSDSDDNEGRLTFGE